MALASTQPYIPKYGQQSCDSTMKDSVQRPLVSVICDIFNHEKYLRRCFDGFIMQETTFPFEVLVHDDASSDSSQDIINEYTERYPHIFKPVFQSENQYSKGVSIWMNFQIPRVSGKYIAFCEGDDYWTDSKKLQKQFDLLETHPDICMCCHHVEMLDNATGNIRGDYFDCTEGVTGIRDIIRSNYVQTLSVMLRNDERIFASYKKINPHVVGDYCMWFCASLYGNIYKMADTMAVYRLGSGSYSSMSGLRRHLPLLSLLNRMRCYVNDSDAIEEIDSQIARLEEMLASNSFGLAERRITHCLERKGVVRDLHLIGRSILLLFGDIMKWKIG